MPEEESRPSGRHAFIPAGALIGLGIGLLAGSPGSGVLIGLGLGFLAGAFLHREQPSGTDVSPGSPSGWRGATMLLIGAFLIAIGIGIAVASAQVWTYIVPGFLILIGLLFAIRGLRG